MDYKKERERARKTFGNEGVSILEGVAVDLMPYVQKMIDEIGIDQVRANIAKGLADLERRRAERDTSRRVNDDAV